MPIRPQPRDEDILRLLSRHGIVTNKVLDQRFFPDQKEDEARKSTLKRLKGTDQPYLQKAKLYARGNEVYYFLTAAGAKHIGAPESFTKPVPDNDKRGRLLGQLLFCCLGSVVRLKFTRAEFAQAFPGVLVEGSELARRFDYGGYYLDVDEHGDRRLGRMLVQSGGSELLVRAKEFVRQDERELERFMVEGRYTLAIITASKAKAAQIRQQVALRPLGDIRPVRVVVEAYEQLQGLLAVGVNDAAR